MTTGLVHFVLGRLPDKKLQVYERSGPIELDLVETGWEVAPAP